MNGLRLAACTLTSAIGTGIEPTLAALRQQRSGIVRRRWKTVDLDTCLGEVPGLDDFSVRPELAAFDCRNNRLAQLAQAQGRKRRQPPDSPRAPARQLSPD